MWSVHLLSWTFTGRIIRHAHAIDATVAATALRQPAPVLILTSDPDDMTRLCGRAVDVVRV
jgi:hypothetical protein